MGYLRYNLKLAKVLTVSAIAISGFCIGGAYAQASQINIKAQPLGSALNELSSQTGVVIVAPTHLVQGLTAPSVRGLLAIDEALEQLLASPDLAVRKDTNGVIVIFRQEPKPQTKVQPISLELNSDTDQPNQEATSEPSPAIQETIIVRASRLPEDIRSMPQSVTIIDLADIEAQRKVSSDIGSLLAYSVPSLGVTSNTAISRDQTLRGRKPAILVDGVPVSKPLFNADQDIRAVSPSLIGRVEVINGSTSLYGNGGAGGIINYITRRPENAKPSHTLEIATTVSATNPNQSYSPAVSASTVGRHGGLEYMASGAYERIGRLYDADGDLLAPSPGEAQIGTFESDIYSGFGRAAYYFGQNEISASVIYRSQDQFTEYSVRNGDVAAGVPATATFGKNAAQLLNPGNETLVASAQYGRSGIFGGDMNLQAFYSDFESIFAVNSTRPSRANPSQTILESEKYGVRVDFNTPLRGMTGNILWGGDYSVDQTQQYFATGQLWMPETKLESMAGFAQLDLPLTDRLNLRGGVRAEANEVTVPTYTTYRGVTGTGATLDFSSISWNAGATFAINDRISLFGGYSEGSSVSEIGRVLRDITEDISVEQLDPKAVDVASLEAGVRYSSRRVDVEALLYRNTSELGIQLLDMDSSGIFVAEQQDEEIEGAELSLKWRANDALQVNTTFAWAEGERDSDGDGVVDTPLDNSRIQPFKVTGSLDWTPTDRLRMRLQSVYSGERDPFPGETGRNSSFLGRNDAYVVVDASASYDIDVGILSFGIQNLLNNDYYSRYSQTRNRNDAYSKAPGAMIRIGFEKSF